MKLCIRSLDVAFEDLMRGAVTTNAGTCLPMLRTRKHTLTLYVCDGASDTLRYLPIARGYVVH